MSATQAYVCPLSSQLRVLHSMRQRVTYTSCNVFTESSYECFDINLSIRRSFLRTQATRICPCFVRFWPIFLWFIHGIMDLPIALLSFAFNLISVISDALFPFIHSIWPNHLLFFVSKSYSNLLIVFK
jgi:hypothetical protein